MSARRKLLRRGMKTSATPLAHCFGCGHALTRASHASAAPEPDDVSVCRYCGALARFNADLSLRPTTLAELHPIEAEGALEALRLLGFDAPN